jgi:hypothetical protein
VLDGAEAVADLADDREGGIVAADIDTAPLRSADDKTGRLAIDESLSRTVSTAMRLALRQGAPGRLAQVPEVPRRVERGSFRKRWPQLSMATVGPPGTGIPRSLRSGAALVRSEFDMA